MSKRCEYCEESIPDGWVLCKPCQRAESKAFADDYYDYDLTPEQEAAAERDYERSRARSEWDYYHPGEPCPECELPPRLDAKSGEATSVPLSQSTQADDRTEPQSPEIGTGEGERDAD